MRSVITGKAMEDRKESMNLRKPPAGLSPLGGLFYFIAFLLFLSGCGGGGTDSLGSANSLVSNDQARLTWEAPTTNVDGDPVVDLAGYKVYVGTSSPVIKENSLMIDVGDTTSYVVEGLGVGTYHFAVTAYNSAGIESDLSNEATKNIAGI